MLKSAEELGGVVTQTNDPESPAVVWFEFQRPREGGKTNTLHYTLRARPEEDEYMLFNRAMNLIDEVERQPHGFKAVDTEKPSWNKGGGGNKQSANVPDRFRIVAVEKTSFVNKNAKDGDDPNWYKLVLHGEGGVKCEAFIGNSKWQTDTSPIKKSNQFVKFFEWKTGEKIPVPADRELYAITAQGKYGKEVTDIEPHADSM